MKIVFFGTPEFAVPSLDAIIEHGHEVVAVVTATDKPAGRGHKMLQSEVKKYALEKGLKILQPEKLKDPAFIDTLRELQADLFVVIAFRMMPEVVWAMPPKGTFNLHAALLPAYRGAAPINWAVINGETKTGVTTFFLSHDIDTGDIIDREEIDILPDDNVGTVYDKLMHLGARLTVKTVDNIAAGKAVAVPQEQFMDGENNFSPAPKIFKETCKIDWNRDAVQIHNLVRGLSPYPAAWTILSSRTTAPVEVKIFKTSIIPDSHVSQNKPGDVIIENNEMNVVCGDGKLLKIEELQVAGKKRMDAQAYLRGAHLHEPKLS